MSSVGLLAFVLLLMIGSTICVKRKPKKGFNAKIDKLQSLFQKEIFDLKSELHDLRAELLLEQEKTAWLEELLNGTKNENPDVTEIDSTTFVSPTSVKKMDDLITDVSILKLAFKDEKEVVEKLQADTVLVKAAVDEDKQELVLVADRLNSVENTSTELMRSVNENTKSIIGIHDKFQDDESKAGFVATTSGMKTSVPKKDVDYSDISTDNATYDDIDFIAIETFTTVATTNEAYSKCRAAIREGGIRAANALYVGVTVKRGRDWKWANQDKGGYGTLYRLPANIETSWVGVRWANGGANNYRMGVSGYFDLEIIEDKYDFSKCPLD